MTKTALARTLSEHTDIPTETVGAVLDALFKHVVSTVHLGGAVPIRDFGTFTSSTHQEKRVMNPATKEMMTIPKRMMPIFRPATRFKSLFWKAGGL